MVLPAVVAAGLAAAPPGSLALLALLVLAALAAAARHTQALLRLAAAWLRGRLEPLQRRSGGELVITPCPGGALGRRGGGPRQQACACAVSRPSRPRPPSTVLVHGKALGAAAAGADTWQCSWAAAGGTRQISRPQPRGPLAVHPPLRPGPATGGCSPLQSPSHGPCPLLSNLPGIVLRGFDLDAAALPDPGGPLLLARLVVPEAELAWRGWAAPLELRASGVRVELLQRQAPKVGGVGDGMLLDRGPLLTQGPMQPAGGRLAARSP
jgi:hypothetical protein